jgi:hypothetical protein
MTEQPTDSKWHPFYPRDHIRATCRETCEATSTWLRLVNAWLNARHLEAGLRADLNAHRVARGEMPALAE